MLQRKNNQQKGFSVLEIILAAGLFTLFVSGAMVAVFQGIHLTSYAQNETVATQYAVEGMEAVRSIRNQDFTLLENTSAVGVERSSGVWVFSGTENVLDNQYTRVITIETVQRDGSGDIVESGGNDDADSKKITVTTSWNTSPTQSSSVVLTTYITNWRAVV
jgi:type II secretory pathway pseudopilin PulG